MSTTAPTLEDCEILALDTYCEAGFWPAGDGPSDADPPPAWLSRWDAWQPHGDGYLVAYTPDPEASIALTVFDRNGCTEAECTFNLNVIGCAMFVGAVRALFAEEAP